MPDKIINALSTNQSDQHLLNQGLRQMGVIGYVLLMPPHLAEGIMNCMCLEIDFRNGRDYLYTTDVAKETLDNLNFNNVGSIGAVFTTRRPNTLRLSRFFNKKRLEHLFVTNPDRDALLADGYREEMVDNPIYILNHYTDNSHPLYFYTNSKFAPRSLARKNPNAYITNQTFSIEYAIRDLYDILEDNDIDSDQFSIIEANLSLTVSLSNSVQKFHVTLQENRDFFTIRADTTDNQSEYIKNDISSWPNVLNEFQLWIDRSKQSSIPSIGNKIANDKERIKQYLEGATDFHYRNDNVEPVLGVKEKADIFLKVIRSVIKGDETGLLLGLFGRWGRGKTFFWKALKQKLDTSTFIKFETIEFHAWKYQDTPAAWAYLYEQFVISFYNRPRFFGKINLKWINRIILNTARLGKLNLIISILWLFAAFIWVFFVDFQFKWSLLLNIVSAIGIPTGISIIYYYFSYSAKAKDLFRRYWSEVNFQQFLGIQAEIQKELRCLVRAWISDEKIGERRLILFVDDIDRCSEDRIIQVIDALKVMIDDKVISDRVIVIAAIDEVVLKRAIKNKYFKSVMRDISLNDAEKSAVLESLTKEYMDKLFINGFKLGNLSKDENEEIFKNLVKERTFFEEKIDTGKKIVDTEVEGRPVISKASPSTPDRSAERKSNQIENQSNPSALNFDDIVSFDPESEIMEYELDFLIKAVRKYTNATPRAIRIFYYRYLLAKSFKDILIKNDSDISREWNGNQEGKTILPLLMIEYASQKKHEELLKEIDRIELLSEDRVIVSILNEEFTLSRHLYLSLLKIVEIVVPY